MGHDGGVATTITASVLFYDLVGSTERQMRLGDERADVFLRRMFLSADRIAQRTRGTLVKRLGDGAMIVFKESTADAIAFALDLHDAVVGLDDTDPARVRIGISAGEVAVEDDDIFGTPAIEAARLCAKAEAGQTLITDVVRVLMGSRGRFELASIGEVDLKGIPRPVPAFEVRRMSDFLAATPRAATPAPRVEKRPSMSTPLPPPTGPASPPRAAANRGAAWAGVGVVAALVFGVAAWKGSRSTPRVATTVVSASSTASLPNKVATTLAPAQEAAASSSAGTLASKAVSPPASAVSGAPLELAIGGEPIPLTFTRPGEKIVAEFRGKVGGAIYVQYKPLDITGGVRITMLYPNGKVIATEDLADSSSIGGNTVDGIHRIEIENLNGALGTCTLWLF